MKATVCIRKIHQHPPGFGSMSFGRTEKIEFIVKESAGINLGYPTFRDLTKKATEN